MQQDKPPHSGTMIDDLLAKVDETLQDGADKLRRAHESTKKESTADTNVSSLRQS